MKTVNIDRIGLRYHKLIVLERAPDVKNTVYYKCLCDCGTIKNIAISSLRSGHTRSCGCIRKEALQAYGQRKQQSSRAQYNEIYNSYKTRAKKKNIEFTLTREEFYCLIKQPCYYCHTEPNQKMRDTYISVYNGIDRFNNTKGYTLDNCVTACTFCNTAKGSMSVQEFIKRVKMICEVHGG